MQGEKKWVSCCISSSLGKKKHCLMLLLKMRPLQCPALNLIFKPLNTFSSLFLVSPLKLPPSFHILLYHTIFNFQLVSGQPHPVRGLREKQEVPCDRGGQQASTGGPGSPEAPGSEGHQLHLRPYLSCVLHPSRSNNNIIDTLKRH